MNNEIGYFVFGIEMAILEVVESHVDSLHTNPKCNDQQTKEEFLVLHIGSLLEGQEDSAKFVKANCKR